MIRVQRTADTHVKVTFALPDAGEPVSVIGDFNDWDALAHPMKKRSNGTRSAAVALPAGHVVRFRYLDANGQFFDDPDVDWFEANGYGGTHTVLAV
jgi:1,4-alpha-glucan branching enzyme